MVANQVVDLETRIVGLEPVFDLPGGYARSAMPWKKPVRAKTTTALPANTYSNGTAGVGATLTGNSNGALVAQDGVTLVVDDRLLVANEATASNNGIYVVTQVGSGAAPYILTRSTDTNNGAYLVCATTKVSEGATYADTEWVCTTNAPITIGTTAVDWEASGGGSGGVQSLPILVTAMTPRTTNGATLGLTETTTNKVMIPTLDFDAATDEFAQIIVPMPKSWNEGTITAQFVWTASAGTAAQVVVWGIQAVAISDDDPADVAFGTAVTVSDALTATGDVMQTAYTGALTIAGTAAEGDLVCIQVYRDANDAADTLAADAKLIAFRLNYTTNVGDDG